MIINNIKAVILACLLVIAFGKATDVHGKGGGHHLALLGDSMTWIGGDSCQYATGWTHYLNGSDMADSIEMYARSGATWTNTALTESDPSFYSEKLHDNNVIYNQVLRLIRRVKSGESPTPDITIIFAGANDAWFADQRPGIFNIQDSLTQFSGLTLPSEATTLQKSVALVCDILKETFPDNRLIIVTPLQMSKVSAECTARISDIIEDTAKSRGISVLRSDKGVNILHDVEKAAPNYTYDGVHTNPAGAILVADFIMTYLRSCIGYIL